MASLDPEKNRLYRSAADLHSGHWERLAGRDPSEVASAATARWVGGAFVLPLLGTPLRVDPRARSLSFPDEPERPVGFQRALVAVAYLGGVMEIPLKGEWVGFREMPGGEGFFRGPHALPTDRLETAFGVDPGALHAAARPLGGRPVDLADVGVELPALPRVPVRVLVWAGDGELGASSGLLTDARAHFHLPLDVLWALSNLLVSDLIRRVV